MLDKGHWLQTEVYTAAMQLSGQIARMKDISDSGRAVLDCEAVENAALSGMDAADGIVPHHGAAQAGGVLQGAQRADGA